MWMARNAAPAARGKKNEDAAQDKGFASKYHISSRHVKGRVKGESTARKMVFSTHHTPKKKVLFGTFRFERYWQTFFWIRMLEQRARVKISSCMVGLTRDEQREQEKCSGSHKSVQGVPGLSLHQEIPSFDITQPWEGTLDKRYACFRSSEMFL